MAPLFRLRCLALGAVTLAVAALTAALPPSAHATFPGADGRIVGSFYRGSFCIRNGATCLRFTSRLVTVDSDGAHPSTLPLGFAGALEAPAVSADGTRLVATGVDDNGKVRAGSLAGPLRSPVTFPEVGDPSSVREVSFTPDGGLVYTADGSIYAPSRRGGPARKLLSAGANEFLIAPRMSPDGSTVAFIRVTDEPVVGQVPVLWLVNADGSGLRRLAGGLTQPDWSPDGRQLVATDEDFRLTIVDAATGAIVRRGDENAAGNTPVWSPSGTRIAFAPVFGGEGAWFATVSSDLTGVREVKVPERRDGRMRGLAWQSQPQP